MQVGHVGIVWKRKADSSRRIASVAIERKQIASYLSGHSSVSFVGSPFKSSFLTSILLLLIFFLYMSMWLSGKNWESSERIQECNYYQNHGVSKNLENQLKDQSKKPIKAMGLWLSESLDVLQEKLEQELRVLEQQVKDLEEWLDYHLKDLGSEEECITFTI
ncbi:small integral membrane protein 23 isoform X1 [Macrotis lagotis]|uniref:small integral membrane protein 23 isoform X1 n=1 Tax=Macrotis lagotis TaxID=92651 RepID=UPI003D680D75